MFLLGDTEIGKGEHGERRNRGLNINPRGRAAGQGVRKRHEAERVLAIFRSISAKIFHLFKYRVGQKNGYF